MSSGVDHRLNRQHHSDFEGQSFASWTVIGDLGIFVKCPANSVTDKLANDTKPKCLNMFLNRMSDVEHPITFPALRYPKMQALPSRIEQLLRLGGDLSYWYRSSRVSIPPFMANSKV